MVGDHHGGLLALVAEAAGVGVTTIRDLELHLLDAQPAAIVGLHQEFVAGGRLDNLVSAGLGKED